MEIIFVKLFKSIFVCIYEYSTNFFLVDFELDSVSDIKMLVRLKRKTKIYKNYKHYLHP